LMRTPGAIDPLGNSSAHFLRYAAALQNVRT
jgi:hypothetical protein